MEIIEAIKRRRSIRAFEKENVPEKTLEKLIEAARWAPSAGNIQPWEFIVVRRPEIKNLLVEAAFGQSFIEEADVVIVVCADENRSSQRYGARGKTLYCIQDTAAAIENILLAADSLDLGTCWIGAFDESRVAKALKTPEGTRPVALIPVGRSAESPSPRRRRPLSEIMHYDIY